MDERGKIVEEATEELWNKIIDMQMGNPVRSEMWLEVIDRLKRRTEERREEIDGMLGDWGEER